MTDKHTVLPALTDQDYNDIKKGFQKAKKFSTILEALKKLHEYMETIYADDYPEEIYAIVVDAIKSADGL